MTDNPPAGYGVGPGEFCTPSGRRVAASSPADGPPLQGKLALTPPAVTVNTVAAASDYLPITVNLDVNSADVLQQDHPAVVRYSILPIENADGTLPTGLDAVVNCDPDHVGTGDKQCDLQGHWTFNLASRSLRSAPRTIWVQVPRTTIPRKWLLVARSEWAADPATAVINAAPVFVPSTDPGGYAGTVSWANAGTPASGTLSVPIQAVVAAGNMALVEPTRTLLPEGHVVLSRDPSKSTMLGWLTAVVSDQLTRYDIRLDLGNLTYDAATGHLAGAITVSTGSGAAGTVWSLALDRSSDVNTAACPVTGCAAATYCDSLMNVCLPGSGPAAGAGIVARASATPTKTLPAAQLALWGSALTTVATNNSALLGGSGVTGIDRAYCYKSQEPRPARFGVAGTLVAGPSGDLTCLREDSPSRDVYTQTTFDFVNRQTEADLDANGAQMFNLLQRCVADLKRQPPDVPTLANTLDTGDQDPNAGRCARLAQLFLALRANAPSGVGQVLGEVSMRRVTQVLRQWLGLQAYVATSSVQTRQYDEALGTTNESADVRLGDALDLVDRGLRVVLDPAVRPQFTEGPAVASVAVNPDYRIMSRPLSRWTFNNVTGGSDPGADGAVAFMTSGADTSGKGLLTPTAAASCQSTQPISLGNDRFTIVFDAANPIQGTAGALFQKVAASGQRIWVEANAAGTNQLNLALKDSNGGVATFPTLSSVGGAWGLLAFVANSGSYQLYVAQPGVNQISVLAATSVQNGGPRWGDAGPVRLACDMPRACPQHGSCASWDRNVPGDGLDVRTTSFNQVAWEISKRCNGGACDVGVTAADCDRSAVAARQTAISGLLVNPPAAAVNAFQVGGHFTRTAVVDPPDTGAGFAPRIGVMTTVTATCTLSYVNLPQPVTGVKPVCDCAAASPAWAPQGVFYDELSLWDRAIDAEEFAAMAASYGFVATNETIRPTTPVAGKEQSTGLAAHLVEAAAADLSLVAAYVEAARATSYGECYLGGASAVRDLAVDRAGRNLRLITVLEAEAANLASMPGASAAPWYARYQADLSTLAANRAKVIQGLQLLNQCKNPLNIAEEQLPLYTGQSSTDADRFFASTHFLAAQAQTFIDKATASLAKAQAAYNAQISGDFTQTLGPSEQQILVQNVKVNYEGTLRRYCGAPAGSKMLIDSFRDGTLDATRCYFKTERPECQNLATADMKDVPPDCMRGELGEQIVAIQSALLDFKNAQASYTRALDKFDADTQYCARRKKALDGLTDLLEQHQKTMRQYRGQESNADLIGGALSVITNPQGFFGTAAKLFTNTVNYNAAGAQDGYDLEKMKRGDDLDIKACFHDADNDQFAIDAANDVILRVLQTIRAAILTVNDAKATLDGIAIEASGQIDRTAALDRTPPHLHYWIANDIDTYNRQMKVARRLTYLAVRAYEYESQASSSQRGDVLTARRPSDLDAITTVLLGKTAPVSGGTFHPGSDGIELSLRTELLHLDDLANNVHRAPDDPPVSATTLLQRYLTSDSSKFYFNNGTLRGRAIRFSIRPELWNQEFCAERIVAVRPYVVGSGVRPTQPAITLIQENAFSSQTCGDPGKVHLTRVGAATNLVTDDTSANFTAVSSDTSMSMALVPASVTSRNDLDGLPFAPPSDFNGRGFYANYILVFPDAAPCTKTATGELVSCQGWSVDRLAKVEDVLLRFDIGFATRQN